MIEAIAVDESNWKPKSLNNVTSLHTFISECRFVLDQLVTDVQARLNTVAMDMDESAKDALSGKKDFDAVVLKLLDKLKGGGGIALPEIAKLEQFFASV